MSLLAQVNQPNPQGYYFALDTRPNDPVVSAPAFEATGLGILSGVGSFSARGDGDNVAALQSFNMDTAAGIRQFSIGLDGTSGALNAGNNLAIASYNNAGAFIGDALKITRATGDVEIAADLVMNGTITGATNIVLGQNTYLVDQTYVAPSPPAAGFTESVVATFTPPKAGLYLLSASFGVDANALDGYTAAPPDNIGWTLRPTAPPPYPPDSIGSVSLPVFTVAAGAANDYGLTTASLANLAAVQYDIIAVVDNISGTMAGPAPLSTRLKVTSLA